MTDECGLCRAPKIETDRARYNWIAWLATGESVCGNESVLNVSGRGNCWKSHTSAHDLRANKHASENVSIGNNFNDRIETTETIASPYLDTILRNNWYRDWNCALLNPFTAWFVYATRTHFFLCFPTTSFSYFFAFLFFVLFDRSSIFYDYYFISRANHCEK